MAAAFIAAAALCLALITAETCRRGLTLPQALMLTALPWGLLTAGAVQSGAPLWTLAAGVLGSAGVIAGRIAWAGPAS